MTLSIYVHYPFCKSKCPYCDFNSHVRSHIDDAKFLAAYEQEISFFAPQLKNRQIKTIFFGGGTPSLMPLNLVEKILAKISQFWTIEKSCEITLEANPTSFESEKFLAFKNLGINRLSLGIQALNDDDLKFLGRNHSAKEAIATIKKTSEIFENFSFDLIYARPTQTLKLWQNELNQALEFGSKHLSLYQLTIEKGTKFFSEFRQKKFTMPDENLLANFYQLTNEITASKGFELYEISNYAKKNFQCQHNLVYWQGGDYLGIGAGAHSRVHLENFDNKNLSQNYNSIIMLSEPNSWLKAVEKNGAGIQKQENITTSQQLEELILMGLRLSDGISNDIFQNKFNKKINEIFDYKKLQSLVNEGLLTIDDKKINITNKGRILTNAIITKVVLAIA